MSDLDTSQSQDQLTERELQILKLISEGLTNREIAEKLFLSIETIRWYSKRIYSKLHVSNRTQAAAFVREKGLIGDSSTLVSSSDLPRHVLPAQVTAFVGRDQELRDLSGILSNKNNRLVTIFAPGGMGKTRLAVQVAKATIVKFTDGVFFVPLEDLNSRDQIVTAIFEVLNIELPVSSEPEQHLLEYLKNRNILLVLDSFEKLVSESTLVSKLLVNTPELRLIVTSRERLNIEGENIYNLKGLEIPQSEDKEQVLKSSAVKLLLQSAKLVNPKFNVDEVDLPHIVHVCRLVEGMPLGILLAAAWIEVLSPEEIANEIAKNLDFLKTEKQDVPVRQRSIQVVFDYSLGLLEESERSVFKKLSVFQGGFKRQAALEVAGAGVSRLARYVEKSLLQYDPNKKRYRIHELLRQYAIQSLSTDQLLHESYNDHKKYYADFLVLMEHDIKGPNQVNAFDQIQEELENIRMAWNWAIKQDDFEFIDLALESLYWFCIFRGRVSDGEELFQKALTHFVQSPEPVGESRKRRLLLRFNASGEDYKEQLEQAISVSRNDADQSVLAFLLWAYGVNAYVMQDFMRGSEALEESLLIFRELNDQYYSVEALHLLWICNWFLGNISKADSYYRQALEISRTAGYKIAMARALGSAGAFQFMSGDYDSAEISTREALESRRGIKDHSGEAMSLAMLGWLVSIRGNLEDAKLLAETGLSIAREVNSINSKMTAMNILGWISCLENDFEHAIELCEESCTRAPDPTVKISAELVLSYATCGLRDYQSSKRYLRSVLDFCLSVDAHGLMFLSLPIIACNFAAQGLGKRAADLIAIATSFSSSRTGWIMKSKLFSDLQNTLQPELGKKEFILEQDIGGFEELEEIARSSLDLIQ